MTESWESLVRGSTTDVKTMTELKIEISAVVDARGRGACQV